MKANPAPAGRRPTYDRVKRLIDVAGAGVGLVVGAPVVAAAAVALKIEGEGPVLFRQERAGLGGKPFRLFKLRTMKTATTSADGRPLSDADRLTPLGRFLRASSIDELPQLLNVLEGDMSLVGPRPLHTRYLPRYTQEQARRHEVRPGLTGWAQVSGRNALTWEEKFRLDVWYVDHRSLSLDLKILAKTVGRVVRASGIASDGQATMTEFLGSGGAHGAA